MSNLIAKIMSSENLPDSDNRKAYKLIPVPVDHEIEFQRSEDPQVVNMLFTALYGEPCGSQIPLQDCGKIYILQDGKTVATFDPAPQPLSNEYSPSHVRDAVLLRSSPMTLGGTEALERVLNDIDASKQLKTYLDFLTPGTLYPWTERWNAAIALAVGSGYNQLNLGLTAEEEATRDSYAVERYFNRARDVLLNHKPVMTLRWERWGDRLAPDIYHVVLVQDITPIQNLVFTDADRQDLLMRHVSGLVINNIQRAVKLLNHGVGTVFMTPELRIREDEITLVKQLFQHAFNYSVKFHFQGDLLITMSFDKLTDTTPAP